MTLCHRRRVTNLCLAARSAVIASLLLASFVAGAQKIPETNASTLAGNVVHLPLDLRGKIGVLVLGFSKKSSEQCHSWDEGISRDFGSNAHTAYYQMPVLEDVPGLIRSMVIHSMRSDIPAATQVRFVPLLRNELEWKSVAEFGPGDDAYVLIVNDAGEVKWRGHGPLTPASYATFKSTLTAMEK
ncbi:MAG TPA: hypothetical protein VGD59_03445 [Acidisarcina sp.]